MVYRFIDKNKEQFGLRWLCRHFKISLNCYYNYLKDTKRDYYEQRFMVYERIKYIYYNNNRTIGYRPMKIFLQRYGIYLSTTMLSACKSFSRKIPMQTTCIWKFWKAHTFRRKNISSIPFTAIGTILSAPFVRTMNTLPNLHLSKDRCPTTKRCSVSYRPLNSRVILL